MELHEIITPEKILLIEETGLAKEEVLHRIFNECIASSDVTKHEAEIWNTLLERERSMSTGIGQGVAIPHCSTEYVQNLLPVLAILKEGIDFQAIDDIPVRIIILLLLPKNKFEKHIKTLASIARVFNGEEFRKEILVAKTPAEVYDIIFSRSQSSPS